MSFSRPQIARIRSSSCTILLICVSLLGLFLLFGFLPKSHDHVFLTDLSIANIHVTKIERQSGRGGGGENSTYCGVGELALRKALKLQRGEYSRYFFQGQWMDMDMLETSFRELFNVTGKKPVCVIMYMENGFFPCREATENMGATPGCVLPIWLRPGSSDAAVLRTVVASREFRFLQPSYNFSLIIDAGANIGLTALLFSAIYPTAKIVALEPSADNFEILEMNTRNLPNVVLLKAALWSHVSRLNIAPGRYLGEWAYEVSEPKGSTGEENSMEVDSSIVAVTVPFVQRLLNLGTPDFVKIDIETAEEQVFLKSTDRMLFGGLKWMEGVKMISVEVHEALIPDCTQKIRKLFDPDLYFRRTFGELEIFVKYQTGIEHPSI